MKSRWNLLLVVVVLSALASLAQEEKKPAPAPEAKPAQQTEPPQPSEYATLLAKVKAGDFAIDFQRLRFSYMESPERKTAKDTSDEKKQMWQAFNAKDYKKAIENAETVIAQEFVDMDGHYVQAASYRELQDVEKAELQRKIFIGLLDSIRNSGNGKSLDSAYVVINTHEEYVILGVMGLRPHKQSLVQKDGHSYDVLEAVDQKTKQSVTLYFNVDIPFKHYLG
jgi:hypothetical protein